MHEERETEPTVETSPTMATSWSNANGPLSGIRVLDLSAVVSGPFGTAMLAEQGADVVSVEQASQPDVIRYSGPLAETANGVSAFWSTIHRNKRAIALDLKHADGKALLLQLVEKADVVVQNFRPGAIERLGLGWDVLSKVNPDLIMCSVSAYGSDGPYVQRPAYDPIIQAVAGYASVQVDSNGAPQLIRTIVCDKVTALHVAQSICAALVARANGAGGQHIELSMLGASLHFLWPDAMWGHTYLDHDVDMPDLASIYRLQESKDGWVIVYAISTDPQWQAMCTVLGRRDLATDERFADLQARLRHGDAANEAIQTETRKLNTAEIVAMMDAAGVPVAPVHTRESLLEDPQVRHSGIIQDTVHPSAGRIRSARPVASFSKTPSNLHRPAPQFGEHTDEILAELDVDASDVAALRQQGVVS